MSADEGSPREDNNNSIEDGNTSIIGKVKSRVSSIFPQKFSKWFTPSADAKNQNGNLRRRRTESEDQEEDEEADGDGEGPIITTPYKAPPAKRSRLNVNETMFNFKGNDNLMSSSTPYIPVSCKIRHANIVNPDSPEVVDIFSEPQEIRNRRTLNITEVATRRTYAAIPDEFVIPSTSRGFRGLQQDIIEVPDENEEDEVDDGVQINGRYTPASESGGDSRGSSVQPKLTRNFDENERGLGGEFNLDSHLEGRKSLFANSKNKFNINNSTLSLTSFNRRRFNSSIYGSTSALSDSRLLHTFSPFYRGPTTFGGANAYSRYSTNNSTRNVRLTPTLIRPTSSLSSSLATSNTSLNQAGTSAPISSTAQRILELIQDFPTPLSDAKKLSSTLKLSMNSSATSQSNPPLANTRSKRFSDLLDIPSARPIHLSRVRTPYTRNDPVSQQLPSNKELQVPSMVQLLKMKKLLSNTEKAREIAGKSSSALNVEQEYKLPNQEDKQCTQPPQKRSGKIQNKISNVRAGSKKQFDAESEESVAPVNLPNIALPFMKEVPKIDIDIAPKVVPPQPTVHATAEKIVTPKVTSTVSQMDESKEISTPKSGNVAPIMSTGLGKTPSSFQFAEPIKVANGVSTTPSNSTFNNFKFSPPVPADTIFKAKLPETPSTPIVPETKNSSPPKLKTGSVFAALMKPIAPVTTPLSAVVKPAGNKWECNVCMIKNDESRDKCEACTTPKSKPAQSLPPLTAFGSSMTSSKKWECGVCMIKNDESREKCEACTTPKPKATPVSAPLKTTDSGFQNILAKQSAKWECSDCMTRNEQNSDKCLCCQKAKPGAKPTIQTTNSGFPSNPLKTTDSGFQSILAKQAEKWECPACLTRNEANRSKCNCCDQAKPGAPAEDVPKFSFGSNSASKFTFGFAGAVKESEIRKDEGKPPAPSLPSTTVQPIPTLQFGAESKTTAKDEVDKKENTFTFGVKPTSTSVTSSAPTSTFSFGLPTPAAAATKTTSAPSTGLTFGSSTSSSAPSTVPTFGSAVSTPAPVFGSPATPASAPAPAVSKPEEVKSGFSFGSTTTQSTPAPAFGAGPTKTESAPASSPFVFGKPAAPTISATPNFGGSTITATTTQPATTPTNLFTFGSASKTETTTFGSSNVAKPSVPAFGSSIAKPEAPTFGSPAAKPEVPTFGSPSVNKPVGGMVFGASPAPKAEVPAFGSPAAKSELPSFGSALKTNESKPFVFGSEASSGSANLSFGGSTIQPATPAFGGSTFGSTTNSTPAFGTNSAPAGTAMFGSPAAPAFGSSGGLNNNSGFGGSNSGFGGFGATASPAASRSDEGPMAKKPFQFGGSTASNTPAATTFGQNNNNNTQKAFNFSAPSAQPSSGAFNFTGSSGTESTNSSQLFQFGATNPTPVFNFVGSETASGGAFQFNANNTTVPTNNIFAPQPTAPNNQQKRKIISATRRKPR